MKLLLILEDDEAIVERTVKIKDESVYDFDDIGFQVIKMIETLKESKKPL